MRVRAKVRARVKGEDEGGYDALCSELIFVNGLRTDLILLWSATAAC
jgi:hypothetical protein